MKPPILVDFPESFETERLVIRSPLPGDGPEVHAAIRESIEELSAWMAWPNEHRTVDDSEANARRARVAFMARSELRLHIYLKGADTLVGIAGLQGIDWEVPKFEIGYWCRTSFTGNGYITEAVRAITHIAFDTMGARRVEIRCDPTTSRARGSPNVPASHSKPRSTITNSAPTEPSETPSSTPAYAGDYESGSWN